MQCFRAILLIALLALARSGEGAPGPRSLADLRELDITCFVPGWLPEGFKLRSVSVTYDEPGPDESGGRFPLYSIEYANEREQTFSIECAREGIGDRNLLETEDSESIAIPSPLGRMYVISTPRAKGGRKKEIRSNWTSDANMVFEKRKNPQDHPVLGRYHGFSASGITMRQFQRIIDSLHPVNSKVRQ